MTSDAHSRPWFRRHRTLLLGLAAILLFITLLLGYRRWQNHRLQKQITAHLAAIRAQGYPVTLAELDAWYVTPPDPENAAIEIIAASRHITDYWTHGGQWMDINYSNNLHEATLPLSVPARTALASIIHSNQTALTLLRTGLAKPHCRYPVDYVTYHLPAVNNARAAARELNQLLRWETFHFQAEGQSEAALDSLITQLQLADTLSADPSLMALMIRHGILDSALRSLAKQFSADSPSTNSLSRLSPLLLKLDQETSLPRALAGERIYFLERETQKDIASGIYYKTPFDNWPTNLHALGPLIYKYGGHELSDRFHYLELLSSAIESAETSSAAMLRFANDTKTTYPEDAKPAWSQTRTSNTAGILPFLIRTTLSSQAHCRLAHVAVAVEEYWNHHGKLPNQMNDMVPAYLEKIPDDPFSASGVLYRRTAEGYRIYSVDEDGLNDGGKDYTERKKPLTSDLVFKVERTNKPRSK